MNEPVFINDKRQSLSTGLRLHLSLMKIPLSLFIGISAVFGFVIHKNQLTISLLLTGAGVFLLACGGAALNNYQDRDYDRLLERTKNRPLPAGQLSPRRALLVSGIAIPAGLTGLYLIDGNVLLPCLGLIAILLYNGIYTPLKQRFFFPLSIGAACGMIPPLIGWTAAGGNVFSFKIFFVMMIFGLWQLPHFWLVLLNHKADYHRAGVPSMIQFFSVRQFEKIVFIWILNFSIMLLSIPARYMKTGPISGYLIVITAFSLVVITFINLFLSSGKQNYHRIFTYLNGTIFFVMIIVISDSIFFG
jgi:heme o synthase